MVLMLLSILMYRYKYACFIVYFIYLYVFVYRLYDDAYYYDFVYQGCIDLVVKQSLDWLLFVCGFSCLCLVPNYNIVYMYSISFYLYIFCFTVLYLFVCMYVVCLLVGCICALDPPCVFGCSSPACSMWFMFLPLVLVGIDFGGFASRCQKATIRLCYCPLLSNCLFCCTAQHHNHSRSC